MTTLHYSEFATLARCERAWVYRYALQSNEKGGKHAAHLGTLCHVWGESWLKGEGVELPSTWQSLEHSGSDAPGELVTYSLSDFDPDVVAKARWLAARYVAHYGSAPPSHWSVISTEQWLTAQTPWGTIAGTVDAIVEIDGELWLYERKSYGSKGRLNWVKVDPQLGVYDLLVQANYGKPAFGILFDGLYTYQWKPVKPTLASLNEVVCEQYPMLIKPAERKEAARQLQAEHPGIERDPSESFERVPVDLTDEHRRTTSNYLRAAVGRRDTLLLDLRMYADSSVLDQAIPNVGRACDYCDFKAQCWNDLGGVEPFEIEVDDDEAEPV